MDSLAHHSVDDSPSDSSILVLRTARKYGTFMSQSIEKTLQQTMLFLRDENVFRSRRRDIGTLVSAFRSRMLFSDPISFIAYWGIGKKRKVGAAEKEAIAFQQEWLQRLQRLLLVPITVEFLLTDTHAKVNGIPDELANEYISSTTEFLVGYGYKSICMSEFLARGMSGRPSAIISEYVVDSNDWAALPTAMTSELERLAHKRSAWGEARSSAIEYYRQNIIESANISLVRPTDIFLTYQLPSMGFMTPCLPHLHTYVSSGRNVRRPWFEEK